jgi:tetratricopeptide (TPR) repeat protein
MSSHPSIPTGKSLIPLDLVLKIDALLDVKPSISTLRKSNRRISATFRTFDDKKTSIDLNVCRPILSSHYRQIPKVKEQKSMEDLILIWLDPNINQIKENDSKRKMNLREIINCLEMFNDIDQCLRYIKNIKQEKIFLILSGLLGKTIINELNDCSQILSIYIYGSDERQYKIWSKTYSKMLGIYPNEYELITQIRKDVSSFYRNNICINVINSIDIRERSIQDLTKDEAGFLWSQILIEILLNFPQTSQSKDELIHECRRHYRNNNSQQKKIAEFEKTYNSSNALLWFTKDSFLYRIINKALRTQNILYIFKSRFFIIDIYQQLMKIHRKFIKISKEKIITVYRGQLMPADQLTKLKNNIDGFISINTFFSTSHSSTVAFQFAGDGSRRPMFESVYFEIELNLEINKVPFANVNTISKFGSENEVILCMGTVFRIETVEPLNNFLWYVKLILINENETKKLNHLKEYLMEENDKVSNYLALGKTLQQMGEYNQVQTYYELLLAELPANHPDIPGIYSGLGAAILAMKKDLKLAMKYLKQSITLQQKTFTNNILLFIQTFNSIAAIHVERRKFKSGLILYQFIQEILDNIHVGPKIHRILKARAEICNNIGHIYSKIGQLSLALKYYKISLTIDRKILPPNHPNIALSLNNIGFIYLTKRDSETAEKYLQEANAIRQQSLPLEYHPDLAQMYNNLGAMHYSKANFNKALFHFEKALEIQLKCLPPVNSDTASLYNSLGNTYSGKEDYQMALQMYENSLKIAQQCWPTFHPQISEVHQNIGSVCRSLGNYERALNSCEKALEIGLKCLPPTHSDLAEIYEEIGRIYSETDNHTMATTNFHKAIDIYTKNPPINQKSLGTLYEQLGREYYDQEYYQDALRYFKKALEIYQTSKEEESSFAVLYYHLGKAYYQNAEYEDALLYYDKCLHFESETISKSNLRSLSQTYHAIGEIFQTLNDYQMALTNYEKALETILKEDSLSKSSDNSSLTEKYQKDIQIVKAFL